MFWSRRMTNAWNWKIYGENQTATEFPFQHLSVGDIKRQFNCRNGGGWRKIAITVQWNWINSCARGKKAIHRSEGNDRSFDDDKRQTTNVGFSLTIDKLTVVYWKFLMKAYSNRVQSLQGLGKITRAMQNSIITKYKNSKLQTKIEILLIFTEELSGLNLGMSFYFIQNYHLKFKWLSYLIKFLSF